MKKLFILFISIIVFISCRKEVEKPKETIVLGRQEGIQSFQQFKNLGRDSMAVEQLVSLIKLYGYDSATNEIKDLKEWAISKKINLDSLKTVGLNYNKMIDDITSSKNSYVTNEDANPCVMSEDFIKSDLRYPDTVDFSMFDCSTENNSDGSYTILRKVSAKNGFGVESSYIYKVKLGFKGGNTVDINDWELISIESEEYK